MSLYYFHGYFFGDGYLNPPEDFGADERSRTSDLLITNQLLYQLSYISQGLKFSKSHSRPTNPKR